MTTDAAELVAASSYRFATAMGRFGGFEPEPLIAVAVSGGADSMALLRLAHAWAADRGGKVLALGFDHGLRPESAAEAAAVAAWCADLGVSHRLLTVAAPLPQTGTEAAARAARYAAFEAACAEAGALHLLVGHHAGDQRETVAMRSARGEGLGRAGMAAMDYRRACRLLRPLLEFEKSDLVAVCRALGQGWVEDPSNASDAFERNRVRKSLVRMSAAELAAIGNIAVAAGRARMEAERRIAEAMVAWVRISPLGYAWVDWRAWRGAPRDAAADREFLGRLAHTIGGRAYPPARAVLEAALAALEAGRPTTAGGCVLRFGGHGLWVLRENRTQAAPEEGDRWDGRFAAPAGLALRAAQGAEERDRCRAALAAAGNVEKLPPSAVFGRLPVWDGPDGLCVPGLSRYDPAIRAARFSPSQPATVAAAWLAPVGARLMY